MKILSVICLFLKKAIYDGKLFRVEICPKMNILFSISALVLLFCATFRLSWKLFPIPDLFSPCRRSIGKWSKILTRCSHRKMMEIMFSHCSALRMKVATMIYSGMLIDCYPPLPRFFFKFFEPSDYDNPIP